MVETVTLKKPYIVRVRFCGGCNPEIDRRALWERLQQLNASPPVRLKFAAVGTGGRADVVLKINGCAHACLDESHCGENDAPVRLSVQGCALNRHAVPEMDLPAAVFACIQALIDASEQPTQPVE